METGIALLNCISRELAKLKEYRAEILDSGPVAPARARLDKTTNAKGTNYARVRGNGKAKSLGTVGSELHKDWQQRIKRRNALRQIEKQRKELLNTRALLEKGIDWEFSTEPDVLQLDQSVYVAPSVTASVRPKPKAKPKSEPKLSYVCKRQPSAGGIVHAFAGEIGRSNWRSPALCGAKPSSKKSWEISEWAEVSCPKCRQKLD